MIAIDLDQCHDVTGGFLFPRPCEPPWFPPRFPPFPDPWGGEPISVIAWFPICALVD